MKPEDRTSSLAALDKALPIAHGQIAEIKEILARLDLVPDRDLSPEQARSIRRANILLDGSEREFENLLRSGADMQEEILADLHATRDAIASTEAEIGRKTRELASKSREAEGALADMRREFRRNGGTWGKNLDFFLDSYAFLLGN